MARTSWRCRRQSHPDVKPCPGNDQHAVKNDLPLGLRGSQPASVAPTMTKRSVEPAALAMPLHCGLMPLPPAPRLARPAETERLYRIWLGTFEGPG